MTHWLPVMLNPVHTSRGALAELARTIATISYGRDGLPTTTQHVNAVLTVLPKLMNTMVVQLMSDADSNSGVVSRHVSDRAVEGYMYAHHMLLKLTEACPSIAHEASRRVTDFVRNEATRSKSHVPDLGAWLCLLTLANTTWNQVAICVLKEVFDRQVRWISQDFPNLLYSNKVPVQERRWGMANAPTIEERLRDTLTASRTSMRLLMFQVAFLSLIGRPAGVSAQDIITRYDNGLGTQGPGIRKQLQLQCQAICAVGTWPDFFRRVAVEVPSQVFLHDMLETAVVNSARKGYHRGSQPPRRGNGGKGHGRGGRLHR